MFGRILATALVAGILAGLFASALQAGRLIPLILEAEGYERALASSHAHAEDGAARSGSPAWAPADGPERTFYTVLANILAATGFALLLTAGFALSGDVDAGRGVLWGMGGFAAFHLAPALGLPPELPGQVAVPLFERQVWWTGTVVATAAGLLLAVFARSRAVKALGIGLIALPHLVGAPQGPGGSEGPPAELAASFAAASLAVAAAFWALLGGLSGFVFRRLAATG